MKIGKDITKKTGHKQPMIDWIGPILEWLPVKAVAQYEAIRRLGQTNMFDKNMVQRIAYENKFYELVNAMENKQFYPVIMQHYGDLIKLVSKNDIPKAYPLEMAWKLNKKESEEE